ncbi:sel1 repeat family protein [Pelomyxa schiedti]|nr:sel1 repeat family protein [Pelomyxa schiedti]
MACDIGAINNTRNEMMMDALFELQVGNIDVAIALVANAFSGFDSEMNYSINRCGEPCRKQCDQYLPGLLFLYCLRLVINDHVSLHQRIPTCLSRVFSLALSSTPEEIRAHCMRVLSDTSQTSEWAELVSAAAMRGGVDHQQQPSTSPTTTRSSSPSSEQSWSCMYFVALWRLHCRSDNNQQHVQGSSSAQIFGEMSGKFMLAPGSSSDEHSSNPVILAACSVDQINWCPSSATYLGVCYKYGVGGVKKDVHKSVTLWQRAADAGDATAMCHLGVCYDNGVGVEQDIHKAVVMYQRAVYGGNTRAMFNLGLCHHNGDGVEKDVHKAVTLFQRAADAGGADAMCNLGLCYYSGNGVEKDIHKALTLWQRAADAGDADAMCNVGVCYQNGDGVEKDINKAVSLYQRAADGGSSNALYNLARRHSEGVDGLAKDLHQAHRLWLRAADFGHANSIAQLKNLLLTS